MTRVSTGIVALLLLGLAAAGCDRGAGGGPPQVGDCATQGDGGWAKAACTDAGVKVFGVADASDPKACRDVAGADRLASDGDRVLCLGDRDADPQTSMNTAKAGDCVIMPDLRTTRRHDCADPAAPYIVLQRLEDVPRTQAGGECHGVAGAVKAYAINWQADDALSRINRDLNKDSQVDQVVLCLGTNPATAAAASSAAAARSACRFISDPDMSAAVTAAAGKQYTVTSHEDSKLGCDYHFGAGEYITMWPEPGVQWDPGTGDQQFSLDGQRAMYGPDEGNRYVSVEVPSGLFTVVVRLARTSDSFSKAVGIAVFRAARKNIS